MNGIELDKLISSVMDSVDKKQQKKIENIRKRYEWLQKYSTDRGVTAVGRIPVTPTTRTVTYETEHRKKWKCGNSNTIDCGTEIRTHEVKEVTVTDEDIITSIKAVEPHKINESLYWYDNGNYLFTTDQGYIFNLKSLPRPLTKEEKNQINDIMCEVVESKEKLIPILHEANILKAYITPSVLRTHEQTQLATSGECTLILLNLEKEFTKKRKSNTFVYGVDKNLNMYGETVEQSVISGKIKDAIRAKKLHEEAIESALDKIYNITNTCKNEPQYFITPIKENKQLKIYIGSNHFSKYENKGYIVHESDKSYKDKRMNEREGVIIEEEIEHTKTSYYITMSVKAFKSCCYHGRICNKGMYFDANGNEVELTRRPNEQVTIRDEHGNVMTFNSKSDAAKHYNVQNSVISKIISNCPNGDIPTINTKNTKDNKKSVTLLTENNTLIQCESITALAKELNTNKMKVSRTLKGKCNGDKVTINDITYTVVIAD